MRWSRGVSLKGLGGVGTLGCNPRLPIARSVVRKEREFERAPWRQGAFLSRFMGSRLRLKGERMKIFGAGLAAVLVLAGLISLMMWGIPQYRVYSQDLRGQAALAEARQDRQILVEQARAEVEAAQERAEAIRIVGEASQQFPEYRAQEFIGAFGEALKRGDIDKIIYVPTEANIPIIEARN